jgi:hypothetical protein
MRRAFWLLALPVNQLRMLRGELKRMKDFGATHGSTTYRKAASAWRTVKEQANNVVT